MAKPNPFDTYDDMPPAAVTQNPFDQFDPLVETEEPVEETSFLERTGDQFVETGGNIVDEVFGDQVYGDLSSRVQGVLSQLIVGGSNILVDGGMTLVRSMIPDDWEDAIVDFSREKWDQIAQNPTVKEGLEFAQESMEAYAAWAKENPGEAKKIEELVNIAAIARPIRALPKGQPIKRAGGKQRANNRREQVGELLEPIGKKGDGDITTEGLFDTKVYVPSPREKDIIEEVIKVPSVKPRKSSTYNRSAITQHASKMAKELDEYILKKGNPIINRDSLNASLANRVNKLADETLLTGNALEAGIKVYHKAQELIDASDGSALGLLQVRRDLDKWIRSQKNVFDADLENGTSIAVREIRRELNSQVNKAMPSEFVSNSLERQSKLWSARDMLDGKAFKEPDTALGRLLEKARSVTGLHVSATPVGVAATGGVIGSIFGSAPAMGSLVGGGAALTGYAAIKAMRGPRAKEIVGSLLKLADDYPILAPEVNALIQLSEDLGPPEEEVE